MKVGTDSTLLGAWTNTEHASKVLDIGCGTGILSLMLAQRSSAKITAIEIDPVAAAQATYNVEQSAFSKKIKVLPVSLQDFAASTPGNFDLIISNPPYFEKNQASDQRSIARSQNTLSLAELVDNTNQLLSNTGKFYTVLPFDLFELFRDKCLEKGLYLNKQCLIKGHPEAPVKRVLLQVSRQASASCDSEDLIIEEKGRHQYSERYQELLGEYLSIFSTP
jgi:tRNA1Val (adenine37-N6)-methyltransferase